MSQVGPWSVKGIDQRARDAARDAARERGVTLGEYLNSLLMDGDAADERQPYERDRPAPRVATQSLDHLTRRIEATEARSTLAITGIDQSVLGLLARLERSEDNSAAVAAHVDSVIEDIRATHDTLQDKVRNLEDDESNARNLEALRALEEALGKLASHVYEENALVQDETSAIKARVELGLADVTERLDGMEVKVETTLTDAARRVEKAVEQAELRSEGVAKHLAERFSALESDVAGRLTKVDSVNERLDEVTGDVAGALESMEHTLVRIQDRLNRAETTTDAALKSLDATFESLDKRIDAVAEHASPEAADELRRQFEERFDGLAADVRASVAAARAELAHEIERAASTANPEFMGRIEASVADVQQRLAASEARQAEAMLGGGDASADAVRSEFARLSETVDARLSEVETRDATALDRVSEEINSVADSLHQRVAESEERSAEAIEQVGEQVAIVAGRMQARQDEVSRVLTDKVAESAKKQDARLSDALANVSERLEQMREQAATTLSPVQRAITALATRLESLEDFNTPPAAGAMAAALPEVPEIPDFPASAPGPVATDALTETFDAIEDAAAATPSIDEFTEHEPADFEAGVEGWAAADETPYEDDFKGLAEPVREDVDLESAFAAPEPEYVADLPDAPEIDDPVSELESWDDGASEARDSDIFETEAEAAPPPMAAEAEPAPPFAEDEPAIVDAPESEADELPTFRPNDYLARAREAAQTASTDAKTIGTGRKAKKSRGADAPAAKGSGTSRAPIYAAASAVGVAHAAAGGYLHLRGKQVTVASAATQQPSAAIATAVAPEASSAGAPLADGAELASSTADAGALADAAPGIAEPEAVTVAAVKPALEPIPPLPTLEDAAQSGDAAAQYMLGVQRLDDDDFAMGASLVRKAAEQGQASAQYRLAKLHEKGLGVPRDLAEARKWTQRAAKGGNVKAMHDLAVFYAEGEGGSQSYARAVEWFRKASEYGVVDSQYNLGVLYEQGLGISPDLGEALTWFEIAAREGDTGAPKKVRALRARVSAKDAAEATRRAENWSPAYASPAANGDIAADAWKSPGETGIAAVQNALNVFGYEAGEADGALGDATSKAIRAYQRDEKLAPTGRIDDAFIKSLNAKIEAGTAARGSL